MPQPLVIAPSILSGDFAALGAEAAAVEGQGADWIHVDVMDGHFVPPITFGAQMVAALRPRVQAPLDVHLMIASVDPQIDAFAEAGADWLTAHVEAGPHVHRTLQRIRAAGMRAGVALNPGTPASAVEPLLEAADMILVMTVNPGFGGQAFIPAMLPKIRAVAAMIAGSDIRLQVDGGVSPETAPALIAAGADTLVAGSAIFKGGSAASPAPYGAAIRALRAAGDVAV